MQCCINGWPAADTVVGVQTKSDGSDGWPIGRRVILRVRGDDEPIEVDVCYVRLSKLLISLSLIFKRFQISNTYSSFIIPSSRVTRCYVSARINHDVA